MSHEAARTRSVLEACLEHGTDRVNAVRFQRIIALERRAATQEGEVRRLLDERLAQLVNACAEDLGTTITPPDTRPRSALAELIGHIASRAAQDSVPASDAAALAVPSDTPVFADIRQVCAEVRTESQLRQALADAPADAGPLNSASLVHRALTRMRDLSPDYLEHFVAYVDALSA
ncbi:MAG: DUF2894 domain-containing protein, partial [Lysobacter sp.]|nr:DUF2894 domain-containing protein [Lysobacter sp.]